MKNYIDLFAGCGGLSLGINQSKQWKGVFAIEKNPDAFMTLEHNLIRKKGHFDWPEWLPQNALDINDVLRHYSDNLRSLTGSIDLVAGGPPCQGFSTAGRRNEDDTRNKLIDSYIKFVRIVQPKIIFFENVRGFTQQFEKNKHKGRVYSKYVQDALRRKTVDGPGWHVCGKLIDFSEYGLPQKRTRFILVGIRKDLDGLCPSSFFDLLTQNKYPFLNSKKLNVSSTLKDAISDLVKENGEVDSSDSKGFKNGIYGKPTSAYQKLMRRGMCYDVPDSHRFPKHKNETVFKFKYLLDNAPKGVSLPQEIKDILNIKKRTVIPLSANKASATITTLPDDYIHYSEPRIFTVREYARVQSFYDWYEFKGKYTTGGDRRKFEVPRYSQIGNAIPPLFAEQAALTISRMLDNV